VTAPGPPDGHPAAPSGESCPACGAPLDADQEWCLECGAARTTLQNPPDWRIAAAVIVAVIVVVVVALVAALP
jgi:hypothetical protein